MADTAVDFLIENLKALLNGKGDMILVEKNQVDYLYEELNLIRAFLKDWEDKINEHEELRILVTQIKEVACEALPNLDSLVVSDLSTNSESFFTEVEYGFDYFSWMRSFVQKIQSVKKDVVKLYDKKLCGIIVPQADISSTQYSPRVSIPVVDEEVIPQADISPPQYSPRVSIPVVEEESMVGFEDEVSTMKEKLTGVQKQLDIISIVGMAGLGKTTLAQYVYNDPFIMYHFYIRGWTNVSQVYRKRDLLINILSSVVKHKDEICMMSDERLGEELYKRLKGKRYLIVLDDLWNVGAWNDLRSFLPNDRNRSRIVLTTRLKDVALHVQPDSPPHCLRFLSLTESWDLFQKKAFCEKGCPLELTEIGKEVAARCRGLPLAIVVIAGLLAKNKQPDWWKQVAQSVSSHVDGDTVQFMDILGLSYEHLPDHLKPCFIYLAQFPEDYEMPVRRLTSLWIAEGYIQLGEKSLQDVAEDYLKDLTDRSLVMVAKKRSNGGTKSCRVHDMLREFCLRKAQEKNWLHKHNYWNEQADYLNVSVLHKHLCVHSHGFHYVSSNPCFPCISFPLPLAFESIEHPKPHSFIYKLTRVLDLGNITFNCFPIEILQLVHLRYLALYVFYNSMLPSAISKLWCLETFVLFQGPTARVILPLSVWKMENLRHLCITHNVEFAKPTTYWHPCTLKNLQTISSLSFSDSIADILARTPNLRKLGFFRSSVQWGIFSFPNLTNLIHLETLKLTDWSWRELQSGPPQLNKFPPNLKKLTLSGSRLDWEILSTIGMLPNLEVFKLKECSFEAAKWETCDNGFERLKFLKIQDANLKQWIASSNHFPCLERLVLDGCEDLEGIPACLGDIPTLQSIELNWPGISTAISAWQIQKEQYNLGNDGLKILIYPPK